MVNGLLLADKPQGITSHDVVARTRRALGTKKVGHAGTLDPMATGLLILGAGPSTRLLTHLVGLDKEYLATIRLGQATTTDDAEGEALPGTGLVAALRASATGDLASEIADGISALTGEILQRPSSVSAIKVDGKRAYDLVRAGEDVELAARKVTVSAFEVTDRRSVADGAGRAFIDLDVRIECSSGTYIRALARDLGEALGVGGHLTALRRSRIGPFRIDEALAVPAFGEPYLGELLEPAEVAARLFPVIALTDTQAADLANGKRVAVDRPDAPAAAAVAPDGRLVGLVGVENGRTRVITNFPTDGSTPRGSER
ncbi:MAG TPA: tRNA pseudouridine(55) synthase TruB [Microbacteriaceae bacterium]|nr:tRNA pseudouridine(55) synthase TruB [Microbacteriaceae bacterium]